MVAVSVGKEKFLKSGFFTGLLARWRYRFEVPVAFDVDLGGATCFVYEAYGVRHSSIGRNSNNSDIFYKEGNHFYYFLPIISLKFSYTFESGKLLGLQLNTIYIENIVPVFSLNFSVPIEIEKPSRYDGRKYR